MITIESIWRELSDAFEDDDIITHTSEEYEVVFYKTHPEMYKNGEQMDYDLAPYWLISEINHELCTFQERP